MNKSTSYQQIIADGLWHNNQAMVALLGLCPLLAVTNSTINGLSLGLASLIILLATNVSVSAIRPWLIDEIRLPIFVLLIASFVTVIELFMQAYFHGLYQTLGIFIPLIVTNCAIIGRAESFASKRPIDEAAIDGIAMGLGFMLVLTVIGAMREFIAYGSLFSQASMLFGDWGQYIELQLIDDYHGFLLAALPPGAFIALGMLLALKNYYEQRVKPKVVISSIKVEISQ